MGKGVYVLLIFKVQNPVLGQVIVDTTIKKNLPAKGLILSEREYEILDFFFSLFSLGIWYAAEPFLNDTVLFSTLFLFR